MTRKDYILIARALRESRPDTGHERNLLVWAGTCIRMADALATDNPRFDRGRFLSACGGQP